MLVVQRIDATSGFVDAALSDVDPGSFRYYKATPLSAVIGALSPEGIDRIDPIAQNWTTKAITYGLDTATMD